MEKGPIKCEWNLCRIKTQEDWARLCRSSSFPNPGLLIWCFSLLCFLIVWRRLSPWWKSKRRLLCCPTPPKYRHPSTPHPPLTRICFARCQKKKNANAFLVWPGLYAFWLRGDTCLHGENLNGAFRVAPHRQSTGTSRFTRIWTIRIPRSLEVPMEITLPSSCVNLPLNSKFTLSERSLPHVAFFELSGGTCSGHFGEKGKSACRDVENRRNNSINSW